MSTDNASWGHSYAQLMGGLGGNLLNQAADTTLGVANKAVADKVAADAKIQAAAVKQSTDVSAALVDQGTAMRRQRARALMLSGFGSTNLTGSQGGGNQGSFYGKTLLGQ